MELKELKKQEWQKFWKEVPGAGFLQSVQLFERYLKSGKEVYLLGLKKEGKVVAGGLVVAQGKLLGGKIFNMPRGPLLDYRTEDREEILRIFTKLARSFLRKHGGMVLKISPSVWRVLEKEEGEIKFSEVWKEGAKLRRELKRIGYKELGEYEQVKWVYEKTLPRDKAELEASWRSNHRRSVKYAKDRFGLKLRELKKQELVIFVDLIKDSGQKHGFLNPDLKYFEEMKQVFGEKIRFMVAEKDGQPVAGAMFLFDRDEVVYLFSGTNLMGQKYLGAYLLQDWAMTEAMRQGYKYYNFYGTHPTDGIYRFKSGFRGEMKEALGDFMLDLNLKGKIYRLKQKYVEFGRIH